MNLLGLDYGDKHIGVAVATTFIAEPVKVILTQSALDIIHRYIEEYQIEAIVLGLSENETAQKTKHFAQQLSNQFHLPIYFQDETLSSQDTRRQLAKLGAKRSLRQAKTDHYVAATILQDYLDSATMS